MESSRSCWRIFSCPWKYRIAATRVRGVFIFAGIRRDFSVSARVPQRLFPSQRERLPFQLDSRGIPRDSRHSHPCAILCCAYTVELFSSPGRRTVLVFVSTTALQKSDGNVINGSVEHKWGAKNLRFSSNLAAYFSRYIPRRPMRNRNGLDLTA